MKEIYTSLYPNETVAKKVAEYAFAHSSRLSKRASEHHAWGNASQERADYMISPLQAQYQSWTAKSIGAKRVLEIGTFIGFSAMVWSEAVGPDGKVTSLESVPEYAKIAEESWAKAGITNIEVIVGDAAESLSKLACELTAPYDLIFIDADKASYPKYLDLILRFSLPYSKNPRLLRPGGVIMADNVLRRALIADESAANPAAEQLRSNPLWREGDMAGLKQFNDQLVASERLDTFLMPMFDGVGLGRLKD